MHDLITIPKELKAKNQKIQLYIDMIYINGMVFLTSIGCPVYYRKCSYLKEETDDEIYKVLDKAMRTYNRNNYDIARIEYDGGFKSMMDELKDELG